MGWCRVFILTVLIVLGAWASLPVPEAQAQSYDPPTGTSGWCTAVGPGATECFGSPGAACQRQWEVYGEPFLPPAGAAGPNESPSGTQYWNVFHCNWEFHASPAPVSVYFNCTGYPFIPVAPGRCPNESQNFPECGDGAPNFGAYPAPCSPRPIQILSGAKTFHEMDFENSSSTLRLERHFNSFRWAGSPASPLRDPVAAGNWMFGFSVELQLTSALGSGIVTVLTPEGTTLAFEKQSDGSLAPYTTSAYPLARKDFELELNGSWPSTITNLTLSSSSWTLRSPQAEWTITTKVDPVLGTYVVGTPDTYAERQGPTWTFAYGSAGELDTLTDQFGNVLAFTWLMGTGGANHPTAVSEIELPDGYVLRYSYEDTEGGNASPDRLTKVEWIDPLAVVQDSKTYVYGDDHYPAFVTEIQDRNGVGRQFVEYQEDGKAILSAAALGAQETTVVYSQTSTEHVREVTNPLGREATYEFAFLGGYTNNTILAEINEAASPNAPASSQAFGHTGLSMTSETDAEGRITTYTRDAVGRPTQLVEADGTPEERTTGVTWHSTFNVPTQIVQPGLTTDLTYDGSGHPLTRTLTDTTTHTMPYSTYGRTRVWSYDWTAGGQLEAIDGPLTGSGDTVSYTYTAEGYLASTTNQVGHTTTITAHDWRGLPLTIEDENDVATTLTYDIQGRPLTITVDPGGSQSVYAMEYDAVGNLTKLTLPEGGWLEYAYDAANRLTGVENDRGETQAFTVNTVGQPLTQTVRDETTTITLQQSQAYDELSRLIETAGASSETWSLAYDKVNNLTQLTDARAKVWTNSWDALDRVISETDPEAAEVEYAYAPNNQLTTFEDGRDLATTRVVDGFGLTIFEASPDTGERTYWYDAADRLTQLTDADGVQTNYSYDTSGRPLSQTFAGASSEDIAYTYDAVAGGNQGIGRLTSVTDASGSSAFVYDAQGRLTGDTRTIAGETYALGYAYDDNGEVVSVTYPSGHVITFTRDPEGLVTDVVGQEAPLDPTFNILTDITYLPFGPVEHLTFGNGLSLRNSYDLNAWLSGIEVSSLLTTTLNLSFPRDDNGGVTGVVDNASSGRGASYGYTDSGRLQYAVGTWGDNSFSYDAAGNRTEVRTDDGVNVTYEFALISPTSNQVTEIRDTDWNLVRELTYRDGGDLASQAFAGGSTFDFSYSARKRLTDLEENAATTATYAYDYAGRRVSRTLAGSSTVIHYIFDAEGHLLAEHDGSTGAMIREYVWLGDNPVALIANVGGTAELYFIHTGQIGEPLAVTDIGQGLAWSAAVDPWGRATMLASPVGDLDLRLPGQWLQLESGLHQNWMRDYDPTLGRYVQADPIGLVAGQNLYAYVDGDPLNFEDPTGEIIPLLVPIITGAAVGAGTDIAIQLLMNGGKISCIDWKSVGFSAALGAIPGSFGSGTLIRRAGTEFSHALPARFFRSSSRSYQRWLPRSLNGRLNGSYVSPARHYRHDPFRYPVGWRDLGQRLPKPLLLADRVPDWLKLGAGGGAAAGALPSGANCCTR
jgi:RHS repeat-associated protein